MKRLLLALAALFLLAANPIHAQGLLNKVKKAVTKEILGTNEEGSGKSASKVNPEPSCACDDATPVIDLGVFKIDYREITISVNDDGSILLKDRISGKYYVAKDGKTDGPFEADNPRVQQFNKTDNSTSTDRRDADAWISLYPQYIKRSGEKYLISLAGKNYGPYALISDFAVSRQGDKFAAIVIKVVVATENENRELEEQMKNAKTDQEKMDISIKLSQQVQNKIMEGGGPESLQPQLVSNVPGAKYDPVTWMGGVLDGKVKFGEIVVVAPDKIIDLQGNTLIRLDPGTTRNGEMFLKSDNTGYATYNSGTLIFSDKKIMAELFNPYVTKSNGKVMLNYMYYSPSRNAIMRCSFPF